MKSIGIIIFLAFFLAGAYILGRHQDVDSYLNKIDSLQRVIQAEKKTNALLNARIDTLKLQFPKRESFKPLNSKEKPQLLPYPQKSH